MTTPAPLNIPGAALITVRMTESGQEALCGIGIRTEDLTDLALEDAQDVLAAWWAAFRLAIAADVTCTGGTVRYARVDSPVLELAAPASPTGASAAGATSLAPYCALVKWTTTAGGRSGKGRTYLPGVPIAAVGVGGRSFAGGYVTAVETAIGAYLGAAIVAPAGNITPAVLSRTKNVANPILTGALAGIPGIQRRRMR